MPNSKSVSDSNNNQNNARPSAYNAWIVVQCCLFNNCAQRDSFNDLVRQNNEDLNRVFEDSFNESFNDLVRQNNEDLNRAQRDSFNDLVNEDLNYVMYEISEREIERMSTRYQEYTNRLNRPFDENDVD